MKLFAFYATLPLWFKVILGVLSLGLTILLMADRDPSTGRFVKGGTGDVFPQWMKLNSPIEATAGTAVSVETNLPVRISDRQVMEILAIENQFLGLRQGGLDADKSYSAKSSLTKTQQTNAQPVDGDNIIDAFSQLSNNEFAESTETGGAGFAITEIELHDFSSSGHGFLYAGQSMWNTVEGTSGAAVLRSRTRLLYRLVKVSAEELLGLVSQ